MNDREDRKVGNAAAYVAIIAVIVVVVSLGAIVYYTVRDGTFCPTASVVLCWLALVGATTKVVR